MDDVSAIFGIPRIVMPVEVPDFSALPSPLGQIPPPDEPEAAFGDPELFGNMPYVMRSKQYGSGTNGDKVSDDSAALGTDVANPDTWERAYPPLSKTVAISATTSTNPCTVTTAAHGIPSTIGGTVTVVITGNGAAAVNGTHQATRTGATTVTIPVLGTGSATGSMAILTSGVDDDCYPRIAAETTSSDYRDFDVTAPTPGTTTLTEEYFGIYTRRRKWDRTGAKYYVSGETKVGTFSKGTFCGP